MVELRGDAPSISGGRGYGCSINPAVILTSMTIASIFAWFFGSRKNRRKATSLPRYGLGDMIEGRQVTAVRTSWEYQFDDGTQWVEEGG